MSNKTGTTALNFMSFNIRHDHHENSPTQPFAAPPEKSEPFNVEQFTGEQPWTIRKWKVMDTILFHSPDIVALQEPVHHQLLDLEALLGDEYAWIGAGRNDGDKEGEFSALFYKKQTLTVESWKTLWLSETPDIIGSKGWDAKHPRTVTQATFKRNNDNATFTVFNAHLDHKGTESRKESAKIILSRANESRGLGAVFLLGDLNSTEEDLNSTEENAYIILTGGLYKNAKDKNDALENLQQLNQVCASDYSKKTGEPVRPANGHLVLPTHRVVRPSHILANIIKQKEEEEDGLTRDSVFVDTRYEMMTRLTEKGAPGTLSSPFGFRDTFTSFGFGDESERAPIRIDFIMALQNTAAGKINVLYTAVLPNEFGDGLLISDHRPVLARLSW